MRLLTHGCNRWVILLGPYAFKLPKPTSWRDFLFGLLNNMNERAWCRSTGACPVLWMVPGGFLLVMRRVREMTEAEFATFDPQAFCEQHDIRAEHKPNSFGWLDGRVVAIDYGW